MGLALPQYALSWLKNISLDKTCNLVDQGSNKFLRDNKNVKKTLL